MYSQRVTNLKALQEQMTSNPDLTTVNLEVTTLYVYFSNLNKTYFFGFSEGIETFTIQFANAEKRALWENGFLEAKNVLSMLLIFLINIRI